MEAKKISDLLPRSAKMLSARTSPKNLPAKVKQDVMLCKQTYGNAVSFASTFCPQNQIKFCADEERCHLGKAPTLSTIESAYGKETLEAWIECQLNDLNEYSGTQGKLSIEIIEDIAKRISRRYGWILNAAEIMLFCNKLKNGDFGKLFYGAVDAIEINRVLNQFVQDCIRWRSEAQKRKEALRMEEDIIRREKRWEIYSNAIKGIINPPSFLEWQRQNPGLIKNLQPLSELESQYKQLK